MTPFDNTDEKIDPSAHRRNGARTARGVLFSLLFFFALGWQTAQAQLTIKPTTWNVIGLDSNNVNSGPNTFQVGARICNTGAATVNNVRGDFVWDSANAFINLSGSSVVMARTLAPGACVDFYYPVTVTRNSAAYNTARRYHITASGDGTSSVSTPTPRELYVERLISQARNTVTSIVGPTTVYVGQTYNYTINADTATQGYSQLETFLNLSNVTYLVLAVSSSYSAPAGATHDQFYADACGWQNNPTLPDYRSCVGPELFPGGRAGGTTSTTYTVKILGTTGTAVAGSLILDFSGSSYHYAIGPSLTITTLPSQITLSKLANPTATLVGTNVTYTLRLTNTGSASYTITEFVDTPPTSPGTPAYVASSSAYNGAAIGNPVQANGKLTWTGTFTVPAGQSRDLTFRMTMPNIAGSYVNSAIALIDYTQIDTTASPSDNAPATATVTVFTPPSVTLAKSCPAPANCATQAQMPGVDLTYSIAFTNGGGSPAQGLSVIDQIPLNTDYKVGSAAAALGTTNLTVTITYSDDNGTTYTYTPVGGANGAPAGYDRQVTHIRWTFTGNLNQIAPDNSGSVSFLTRIR
ncbi:MAG: hypothetical protein ACR2G4_03395 [Pyrinomonadaceae bacterium]